MKVLVVFVSLCVAAALASPEHDGKGGVKWEARGGKHYAFMKEAKTSHEAGSYCRMLGGYLAVPSDDQENRWLSLKAASLGGEQWWLGIRADYGRKFTGNGKELNYTMWAMGEPNNYMSIFGAEDCVSLVTQKQRWNDIRCGTTLWFICEKEKTYKYSYFNTRARGEVGRLLFALADVPFVDNRIEPADWPAIKPQMLWGVVPEISVSDGTRLCQSNTIFRYLADEFDLMGDSEKEAIYIDMIQGCMSDVLEPIMTIAFLTDEAYKLQLRNETLGKLRSIWLPKTDGFLKHNKNGDGWFVGDKPTLADAFVYHVMSLVTEYFPGEVEQYPKLLSHMTRFGRIPEIAAWVAKRPVTII